MYDILFSVTQKSYSYLKLIRNLYFESSGKRLRSTNQRYPGKKANARGINIHYEIVGHGPKTVLLLPGTLGSTRTDFEPQMRKLNREKYTIVAWDPPGCGFSRPPDRSFKNEFIREDVYLANQLMKEIGRPKYSMIGWSDGGVTGLIMAARYTNNVQKLIALGSKAFITDLDLKLVFATNDISKWNEKIKAPMVRLYGEEYLRKTWEGLYDGYAKLRTINDGDLCREELKNIKCPVLIIHGEKDTMIDHIHPEYLKKQIKNSRLVRFPEGKRNLHLRYHDEFNKIVEQFLDE